MFSHQDLGAGREHSGRGATAPDVPADSGERASVAVTFPSVLDALPCIELRVPVRAPPTEDGGPPCTEPAEVNWVISCAAEAAWPLLEEAALPALVHKYLNGGSAFRQRVSGKDQAF